MLFLFRVGVQYPAPGFVSTDFKSPLHNVFFRGSIFIYIVFLFWNKTESLSMAHRSCPKPKVNFVTINLHVSSNLGSTTVFEVLWWRGWLFCNFSQNLWKTSVKVIIFSRFASKFGCSYTKNKLLEKYFSRFWEQVCNSSFLESFSKVISE